MGIFNKIRKAFRKGGALPHELGPAVKFSAKERSDEDNTRIMAAIINGNTIPKKYVEVKIDVVKNPGTSATCACGGGTCGCAKRKEDYAKAVAAKQKKASATVNPDVAKVAKKADAIKAVAKKAPAKTTEKKEAIKAELADEPKSEQKYPAKKKPTKAELDKITKALNSDKPTPKKK